MGIAFFVGAVSLVPVLIAFFGHMKSPMGYFNEKTFYFPHVSKREPPIVGAEIG